MRGSEMVREEKKNPKTSWFVCCAEGLVVWCKVTERALSPVLYVCFLVLLFCISHLKSI